MQLTEDWEFNVLGVYNYNKHGYLHYYFEFLREYHDKIEGDLLEAGVFRGGSLLGTAMFLKELGSNKTVYGFDTFAGFPPIYHKNDALEMFEVLFDRGQIDADHLEKVRKNIKFRSMTVENPSAKNLSLSGDFSASNKELILNKIELLELDNITLIPGPFDKTMVENLVEPKTITAALFDCDLYGSYCTALPFVWQRLVKGGYIFLDEYYSLKFPGARVAVNEFFDGKPERPARHPVISRDFERWGVIKSSE